MTKYVDASPFESLEGRLLPSDGRILACRRTQAALSVSCLWGMPCFPYDQMNVLNPKSFA